MTERVLDGDDALHHGHMGQHRSLSGTVTHGIDPRHAGAHPVVHRDPSAVGLDPDHLQADIFRVRRAPDGGEYGCHIHLRLALFFG